MMTINKLQRDALDMAIQNLHDELDVRIYTMNDSFLEKTALKYGVNWSAQGTVHPDEARLYAKNMMVAAGIADALNSLELYTDYTVDPNCPDLEQFRAQAKNLMYSLMGATPQGIADALSAVGSF